jgi:hypothetical protein
VEVLSKKKKELVEVDDIPTTPSLQRVKDETTKGPFIFLNK